MTPSGIDRGAEPPYGQSPTLSAPDVWRTELSIGVPVLGVVDDEVPLVQFQLRIKGGQLLDDPGKVGVANLLAETMTEGTASKTPQELEKAIDMLGASINDAAIRMLTRRGAEVIVPESVACCGALTFHMGERHHSRRHMEAAVDGWHALLENGVDAVVLTTSGCATAVRDYGHIFAGTPRAAAAALVSERTRDVTEVLYELGLGDTVDLPRLRVAYHDACSMQHGLRLHDEPRQLLGDAGFEVLEVPEGHICCGSAGTYNILRPDMAEPLQKRKADHIESLRPDLVAAGNIGCIEQISSAIASPVVHTIELLDWATGGPRPSALDSSRPKDIS